MKGRVSCSELQAWGYKVRRWQAMELLDQYIAQTGKQPSDWTTQDIERYLDYVREHITEVVVLHAYDH